MRLYACVTLRVIYYPYHLIYLVQRRMFNVDWRWFFEIETLTEMILHAASCP